MKKQIHLTTDDVRDIMDDKFRETGLDELPKRLKTLDKMMVSVDKIAGDMSAYREEQTLHANVHDRIDLRIDRLEKHTNLVPLAD